MRRMWWLYILGGLVLALGIAFLFGIRGMKETLGLKLNDVDLSGVADGTYQGKYEAGRFQNSIEVTVTDHKITDLNPLRIDPTKAADKKVYEQYYAPTINRIIAAQSPSVDVVSGATASTKALLKAVENALVAAGGKAK